MDDTEEVAGRAAGGDEAALAELLRQIQPGVLRQCSRLLLCRQDAEEACRDVLRQVASGIGGYQSRSRFDTWLYEVTASQVRLTYRGLRRRAAEQACGPVGDRPDRPDPRTTSVIAGSRLDLLDALERLEAAHPDLVTAFVLRDLSAGTYGDIAEHLGAPLGTVKARVHAARVFMRNALATNSSS